MGCRYCMLSCPFDMPKFEYDSPNPRIQKCRMCWERLQEKQVPACCENCGGDALDLRQATRPVGPRPQAHRREPQEIRPPHLRRTRGGRNGLHVPVAGAVRGGGLADQSGREGFPGIHPQFPQLGTDHPDALAGISGGAVLGDRTAGERGSSKLIQPRRSNMAQFGFAFGHGTAHDAVSSDSSYARCCRRGRSSRSSTSSRWRSWPRRPGSSTCDSPEGSARSPTSARITPGGYGKASTSWPVWPWPGEPMSSHSWSTFCGWRSTGPSSA